MRSAPSSARCASPPKRWSASPSRASSASPPATTQPRDFGDEDQALAEGEARIRAIVAERALAAGTDTAEIDIERDVMASIVEGQRMFIEARLVAIASGRPRIAK